MFLLIKDNIVLLLVVCFIASLAMLGLISLAISPTTASIGNLKDIDQGERIVIRGVVTHEKEYYDSISFTVCDISDCIKIITYDKSKRYLSNGDPVTVIGTVRKGYIIADVIEYT